MQAALTSGVSFSAGAALPLAVAALVPPASAIPAVSAAALVALVTLGALSARAGGAPVLKAATRVAVWGALAMAVTAGIGHLVGTAI